MGDFLAARPSTALGEVTPSYKPGVHLCDLGALPAYAIEALREALPAFGRKIKGYDMADAVLTGVETRTSSPVQMARDADFQSPTLRGLYPAGEGAGYAGGILSAAVDGIKVAEAVAVHAPRATMPHGAKASLFATTIGQELPDSKAGGAAVFRLFVKLIHDRQTVLPRLANGITGGYVEFSGLH